MIRRNGKRLAKPMKPHRTQRVIDAHNSGVVNLETMTIATVVETLRVDKQTVSEARRQLGLTKLIKRPHADDGSNSELLRGWK